MRSHIGRVDGDCAMAVMDVAMASKMVMIAFFMYWGTAYRLTNSLWGISFDVTRLPDWLSGPLSKVSAGLLCP